MSVLPAKEADELRTFLKARLTAPVTLDYFTLSAPSLGVSGRRECETREDMGKLLTEVAALSEKIMLRVHHVVAEPEVAEGAGTERGVAPAIVLTGAGKGRVRFLGFPDGMEFGTLLRSLVGVSTGTTGLTPQTKVSLGGLGKDVHIRVFVTPTCPFCPRAAQAAVDMAIESARVTADVVEAQEFTELAERYRVQGVPKTVINDAIELVGAQPESRLLQAVLNAAV